MDISTVTSVTDIVLTGAAEKGDADMVVIGEDRISWNEMLERSGKVANALTAEGIGAHDRVAFIAKNSVEYFELAFGAAFLNAVEVAVNWRLAPPEMAYIVNDAEAKVLVIHEEFAEHLVAMEDDLTYTTRIVVIGSSDEHVSYAAWRDAQDPACDPVAPAGDDVAMQLYTSGTTGLPKGVSCTHRGAYLNSMGQSF